MRSASGPKSAVRAGPKAGRTPKVATSNGSAAVESIPVADKVVIELSQGQVNRVLRMGSGTGNLTMPVSRLVGMRQALAVASPERGDSRFSQSLLAGLVVLATFPTNGTYLGNLEVARMLDMSPSTAHRYLSTLVLAGLLERNPNTRRYRLAW
jgi:hypothetical protein